MMKLTQRIPEPDVEAIFDQLKSIPPSFLIGEWDGDDIDTGHVGHQLLWTCNGLAKRFDLLTMVTLSLSMMIKVSECGTKIGVIAP